MFLGNKKYILLLCPVYEPYQSGGAQSFPLVVEALSSKYKIIVLTEFHSQKSLIEKKTNILILRVLPIRDNFGKKSYIYSVFTFFLSYFIIYVITTAFIFLGVKTFHFTRYCSYFISPLLILLRILKINIIYDCRTEVNEEQIKQFSFAFKYCSYFLANSESAYNSLVKFTLSKIPKKLIINPLKLKDLDLPERYKIGKRLIIENEYIVCIGTISKRKSSLKIIQAYRRATNEMIKNTKNKEKYIPKLLFVGRNDLGSKFINSIRPLENVDYIGSLSHAETLKIIKLSFGTINASISEGIPRSCLESFFLRKPCLVPACVPEFKNYCPEVCVSVTNKKDYLNLIELIKILINNKDYILRKNEKYPIKNHKYSYFESELLKFYDYALGQKN